MFLLSLHFGLHVPCLVWRFPSGTDTEPTGSSWWYWPTPGSGGPWASPSPSSYRCASLFWLVLPTWTSTCEPTCELKCSPRQLHTRHRVAAATRMDKKPTAIKNVRQELHQVILCGNYLARLFLTTAGPRLRGHPRENRTEPIGKDATFPLFFFSSTRKREIRNLLWLSE